MTSKVGRPRVWVVGLLSLLLLVAALVGWQWLDGSYQAERPDPDSTVTTTAPRTVRALGAAWQQGDASAARALASPDVPGAADRLAAVATHARELGLTAVSLRLVEDLGRPGAGGRWSVAADLTWQVPGDDQPARHEVTLDLVPRGGEVLVAGLGGSGREPTWWAEDLAVRRAGRVTVMSARGWAAADALLDRTRAAVRVVQRSLPQWSGRAVVEEPADEASLARALDAPADSYAGIAAVTAPVDGSLAPGAPVHVLVNPQVRARLAGRGVDVVMAHELTHLATSATTGQQPMWLLEGFADWVALRDAALPVRTVAGRLLDRVRSTGVPEQLPTADDFAGSGQDLEATYESAWLACVVLAEQVGPEALVQVYEETGRGIEVGRVLRRHGTSLGAVTGAWQGRLRDLVG